MVEALGKATLNGVTNDTRRPLGVLKTRAQRKVVRGPHPHLVVTCNGARFEAAGSLVLQVNLASKAGRWVLFGKMMEVMRNSRVMMSEAYGVQCRVMLQ